MIILDAQLKQNESNYLFDLIHDWKQGKNSAVLRTYFIIPVEIL